MTVSPEKIAEMLAATEAVPREGYVLIKRGLYWRPNAQGYTGILSEAGIYSDEDSAAYLDEGVTRQLASAAMEVAAATYSDWACDYWREKASRFDPNTIRSILTELTTLRSQLSGITDETSSPVAWRWRFKDDENWRVQTIEPAWLRDRGSVVQPLYVKDDSHD